MDYAIQFQTTDYAFAITDINRLEQEVTLALQCDQLRRKVEENKANLKKAVELCTEIRESCLRLEEVNTYLTLQVDGQHTRVNLESIKKREEEKARKRFQLQRLTSSLNECFQAHEFILLNPEDAGIVTPHHWFEALQLPMENLLKQFSLTRFNYFIVNEVTTLFLKDDQAHTFYFNLSKQNVNAPNVIDTVMSKWEEELDNHIHNTPLTGSGLVFDRIR